MYVNVKQTKTNLHKYFHPSSLDQKWSAKGLNFKKATGLCPSRYYCTLCLLYSVKYIVKSCWLIWKPSGRGASPVSHRPKRTLGSMLSVDHRWQLTPLLTALTAASPGRTCGDPQRSNGPPSRLSFPGLTVGCSGSWSWTHAHNKQLAGRVTEHSTGVTVSCRQRCVRGARSTSIKPGVITSPTYPGQCLRDWRTLSLIV